MPAPAPSQKMQCRYLKPDGVRCTKPALNREFYCFHHGRDRRHTRNALFSPAIIQVPLLDNRAAIQVVLTDIARSLAAGTLDLRISHAMIHALRLAAAQLPRPQSESAPGAAAPAPVEQLPELVDEITLTPEGDELGPELPYHGPNGKPSREWSFSEFLYRSVFSKPASESLPEEGYIEPIEGEGHGQDPALPPPPIAIPAQADSNTAPAISDDSPINIIGLYEPAEDLANTSSDYHLNGSAGGDRIPDVSANEAPSPAQTPCRSGAIRGHLNHRIQATAAIAESRHRRNARSKSSAPTSLRRCQRKKLTSQPNH